MAAMYQICTQKAWERFSSPNKNLELDTFGHQPRHLYSGVLVLIIDESSVLGRCL